jgi:proteasome activator subunit 4
LQEKFKLKSKTVIRKQRTHNHTMDTAALQSLNLRHSGILGLCAFINAYPYDVPEFVPDVFLHLGDHLNDPQPIPVSMFSFTAILMCNRQYFTEYVRVSTASVV